MKFEIEYAAEIDEDLEKFNPEQRRQINIQIEKFAENPLPKNEGGHGNPLGNKHGSNLTGLCKIVLKKLGVRVVYKLVRTDEVMKILVIAARKDEEVYKIASSRIKRG